LLSWDWYACLCIFMIATPQFFSPQEYLNWESQQPIKYEYINGQVFAMTGGTIPHNQVAINLAALLKNHLLGRGYKVLGGDAKVGITDNDPFHYPDVSVTCDNRDRNARQYIRYPCLIVEVLSPSTESEDRGRKFRHYRRIESLQEYLLIDPDCPSVECYRRNERGNWELIHTFIDAFSFAKSDLSFELTSVGLQVPLSLVYEDIDFPFSATE